MNTEVKCSIIEASSNELLYQIEAHNGLIPAYIVKKHDGPIPYIHTFCFPEFFFFPPVWPIRTRLGPYSCVSSEKQKCTRTRVVQKNFGKSSLSKTKQQQNHHNQKRPANPPARFAFRLKSRQRSNKERGRAQQNKKHIQICLRYSDLSHRIILKNMQTNYPLRQ